MWANPHRPASFVTPMEGHLCFSKGRVQNSLIWRCTASLHARVCARARAFQTKKIVGVKMSVCLCGCVSEDPCACTAARPPLLFFFFESSVAPPLYSIPQLSHRPMLRLSIPILLSSVLW